MKAYGFFLLVLSCTAFAATQSESEDLKRRIEILEKQQEELLLSSQEPKSSVGSFINDNLTLGGFYDGGLNFITGPDTDTQATNNSNNLGIILSADFGNRFHFHSQFSNLLEVPLVNEHNDPNGQPDKREYNRYNSLAVVSQSYIQYFVNRKFIVQGGMGFAPFGYALQLRQPTSFVRALGPQIVRNRELVSRLWSGVHIHGSDDIHGKTFGYNVYTHTHTNYAKYIGLGGRVWAAGFDEKLTAGISSQIFRNQFEMIELVGTDLRLNFHPYQLRTEFAQYIARHADTWTAYVEPGYFIYEEDVLLYVFGDYYFGANHETVSGALRQPDPYQKWEYGFGVNWLPISYLRLRAGITFGDYVGHRAIKQGQNRDFTALNLSAGVEF